MSIRKSLVAVGIIVVLGAATFAAAHPGGRDAQGGHNDRKAGNYHFHAGPLAGKTYPSKSAATAALSNPETPAPMPEADPHINRSDPITLEALVTLLIKKGIITRAELDAAMLDHR